MNLIHDSNEFGRTFAKLVRKTMKLSLRFYDLILPKSIIPYHVH